MPKVVRQVEQEVDVEDLNEEIRQYGTQATMGGAFLVNPDGSQGEEIDAGDFLVPRQEMNGLVALGTNVYVVTTIPEAGVFWGSFHRPDGSMACQFFNPQAFTGKYEGTSKAKAPAKRGRKPAQR